MHQKLRDGICDSAVIASKMAVLSALGLVAMLPLGQGLRGLHAAELQDHHPGRRDGDRGGDEGGGPQALVTLDQDMGEYLRCIKGDASQATVEQGRDDPAEAAAGICRLAPTRPPTGAGGSWRPATTSKWRRFAKPRAALARQDRGLHRSDGRRRNSEPPPPAPGGTPMPSNIVQGSGRVFVRAAGWRVELHADPRRYAALLRTRASDKHCVRRTVFIQWLGPGAGVQGLYQIRRHSTRKAMRSPRRRRWCSKKSVRAVVASMGGGGHECGDLRSDLQAAPADAAAHYAERAASMKW